MKRITNIFFFALQSTMLLLGQGTVVSSVHNPLSFEGSKMGFGQEQFTDQVIDEEKLFYAKQVKPSGETEEYFRLTDTSFHFRAKSQDSLFASGKFVLDIHKPIDIDTNYSFCDYGQYYDQVEFTSYHTPIKNGRWWQRDADGDLQLGQYNYGEKTGKWQGFTRDKDFYEIHYLNGDTVAIKNPKHKHISITKRLIVKNNYRYCAKDIVELQDLNSRKKIVLFQPNKVTCKEYLDFDFRKDGKVYLSSDHSQVLRNIPPFCSYELNEQCELVLKPSHTEVPLVFRIKEIRKNILDLRSQN